MSDEKVVWQGEGVSVLADGRFRWRNKSGEWLDPVESWHSDMFGLARALADEGHHG